MVMTLQGLYEYVKDYVDAVGGSAVAGGSPAILLMADCALFS